MKPLHTDLAVKIIQTAAKTKHNVYLHKGRITIDAKSILGVLSLCTIEDIIVESKDLKIRDTIKELLRIEEEAWANYGKA